jgi:glucose dehydrogenase
MKHNRFGLVAGALAAFVTIASIPPSVSAEESASAEIDQRAKDPNQWPAPGRDNQLTRHSELKDINTENIKKLEMIWAQATGALRGAEGQPTMISDVGGKPMLFMVSGCPAMSNCNVVQALDLTDPDNPKVVWNYVKKTDRDESAVPRACCDTVNRGLNYAKGKIITHYQKVKGKDANGRDLRGRRPPISTCRFGSCCPAKLPWAWARLSAAGASFALWAQESPA